MQEKGAKPDYVARANTRPGEDDESFWVDVGAAWNYERDGKSGIAVRLNTRPIGDWDGSFILVAK